VPLKRPERQLRERLLRKVVKLLGNPEQFSGELGEGCLLLVEHVNKTRPALLCVRDGRQHDVSVLPVEDLSPC
jgi:hypothetical protein